MPNSTLSFASSSSFRDVLMAKNLASYSVTGVYTPPSGPLNYEITLSQSPVVDSPGDLIANDPFANQLYPLNQFGPSGGFNLSINFNGPPLPVTPNQGPYEPIQSDLLLSNQLYLTVLPSSPSILNTFLPPNGYTNVKNITDVVNATHYFLPYVFESNGNSTGGLTPVNFISSIYTPYEIVTSTNPTGSDGSLSNDSFIAKIASERLNFLFQERRNLEIYQNSIGLVNLESLSDPFEASLLVSGKEKLIQRNWRITVPEDPITKAFDFLTRINSAYWPVSLIPGDYFDENTQGGLQSQQTSTALNVVNQLTGGFLGPILNIKRNPSQIFLSNTGNGQRSVLFENLNYNRYQPGYQKDFGGILGIAQTLVNLAESIINPNGTISGGYYIGSTNSEPGNITSPSDAIPVNPYGEQVQTPVYGPSELGILYEGNQDSLNFGLAGKSYTDTSDIQGGLVWVSPKYQSNGGFHATPGGGSGSKDEEFNVISSYYDKNKSTNIEFKENSILDNTQRLVDSADNVAGVNRLKHVGNAINQVSKVFHDGYKEMTKGSQVVSYQDDTDGSQQGIEYCRVFTKDTPYYTYGDLQKTDGITTSGRRFTYSVLDNTYNLNIAPLRGVDSTNIIPDDASGKGGHVKKYMFSIENLAWRTSRRPGYTYDDLPVCERGPNGGRVMWFPPYGLTFNDTSSADWNPTQFLGRPEPIYTYKGSSRSGQISFKIIVDHPSVMNTIVEKQLKGVAKERVESIVDSFFAGCVKYDIYQLAIKFNTIPVSELYTIQEILSNPRLTDVETLGQIKKDIPSDASSNTKTGTEDVTTDNSKKETEPDPSLAKFENDYLDFAFYFENDIPGKNPNETTTEEFQSIYDTYVSQTNQDKYATQTLSVFKTGDSNTNVKGFFSSVIETNYKKIAGGDTNFITDAYDILSKGLGTIKIELEGSASAVASVGYNKKLSARRVDTIKRFLESKQIGDKKLDEFFKNKKIEITNVTTNGEQIVIPKQSVETGGNGTTATTENSGTGADVDCTVDQVPNKPGVANDKKNRAIAQIYSTSAMACRRVRVKSITVVPIPQPAPEPVPPNQPDMTGTDGTSNTIPVKKPEPERTIQQKIKEGISKKILRNLLTECDYFEVIKESNPTVYDSFKEKIKYFNPTFHSMTPEGLNARLTFLNQCVRPGETVPVITDKQVKNPDAVNTSFGAPPVLILRIGDFYNTKIIPDSVSFSYDPLVYDMNPEGIGLQPMIANVTLSFKMIGGMGLKEPVDQLQNALSFNYYANTEIYDERATWTEDTSALDKMVVDAIMAKQPPVTVNNTAAAETVNDAGQTIGEIKTTTPLTPSGETGEMSYMKIMDKLYDDSKSYFTNTFNSLDELRAKTNYGMLSLVNVKRNFLKGDNNIGGVDTPVNILGKPDFQDKVDKIVELVISDIENDSNPILFKLVEKGFDDANVLNILRNNLTKYINEVVPTMVADIGEVVNSKMAIPQQDFVQTIRKVNFVCSKTDGKILDTGGVKIYNLTGGELDTLGTDFSAFSTALVDYYDLLTGFGDSTITSLVHPPLYYGDFPEDGDYETSHDTEFDKFGAAETKRFYMIVGRIFEDKNKVKDFSTKIITPNLETVKKPKKLSKVFDDILDDLVDLYKSELKSELKDFETFKKNSDYLKYINGLDEVLEFTKGDARIVTFTTVPDAQTQSAQEKNLNSLYKGDPDTINNLETFNGKIKFN